MDTRPTPAGRGCGGPWLLCPVCSRPRHCYNGPNPKRAEHVHATPQSGGLGDGLPWFSGCVGVWKTAQRPPAERVAVPGFCVPFFSGLAPVITAQIRNSPGLDLQPRNRLALGLVVHRFQGAAVGGKPAHDRRPSLCVSLVSVSRVCTGHDDGRRRGSPGAAMLAAWETSVQATCHLSFEPDALSQEA